MPRHQWVPVPPCKVPIILLLLLARVLLRRIDVEIGFAVPPESVPSQTRGHVVGVAVAAWVIQPAVGSRATSRCSSQHLVAIDGF